MTRDETIAAFVDEHEIRQQGVRVAVKALRQERDALAAEIPSARRSNRREAEIHTGRCGAR